MEFIRRFLTLKPIKKWFSKNSTFGIITPNGWIGRPYDNHHQLSSIEYSENKVLIKIKGGHIFIVTQPLKLSKLDNNLTIAGFNKLEHKYEFLSKPRCNIYESGEMTFVKLRI